MRNKHYKTKSYCVIVSKHGEKIKVDTLLFDSLSDHTWCVSKTGYAVARINGKCIKMHRFILNLDDPKKEVDHINRNKLDNRLCNLRICSHKENGMNQSKTTGRKLPIGISKTPGGKYRSRIMKDGKEINLGHYKTIKEAVFAREKGEKEYFKSFRHNKNF